MFDQYRQKRQIEVTFAQRLDPPMPPGTRIEMSDGSMYQIKAHAGTQATIERVRCWQDWRYRLILLGLLVLVTVGWQIYHARPWSLWSARGDSAVVK